MSESEGQQMVTKDGEPSGDGATSPDQCLEAQLQQGEASKLLSRIEVILNRPQSSENVGAVARAMKNFGLERLVLVAPPRLDLNRAARLAIDARDVLENARTVPTLDEAIAPLLLVIPTTERIPSGREAPLFPQEAATLLVERAGEGPKARVGLLFGEEATGLRLATLARFSHYSSIPSSPRKRSLNLAQAVLLYAWEIDKAAGVAVFGRKPKPKPHAEAAPQKLLDILRSRARELLLAVGFLNPQAPDHILDELMRLLQRARPSRRELELLLAAESQLRRGLRGAGVKGEGAADQGSWESLGSDSSEASD